METSTVGYHDLIPQIEKVTLHSLYACNTDFACAVADIEGYMEREGEKKKVWSMF